ncbi:hypothetical protein OMAG_001632 [Candidatus Omnitrophus magneticus]|uniref:Uncharacterized protein n=1 Tax=Candidatus Omnitrophus magneticus TaxID=1609969 RepID=A0A0F0CMF5_9BACT|nr:hypothetical protein OMAG_001632 [Candidatus Omnitrophus magneticus]
MDIESLWEKAVNETEVVRGRVSELSTFQETAVPYIFLSESLVSEGTTVVRRGKLLVEKPMIILPQSLPYFEGFDFEGEMETREEFVQTFFLLRGVKFPSLKYNNITQELKIEEEFLSKVIQKYKKQLEKKEEINTVLLTGPSECWQFSILFYIGALIGRCAKLDAEKLFKNRKRET